MNKFIVDEDLQVKLHNDEDGTSTPIKGGITTQDFEVISTYQKGWLTFAYLRDHQGIWWCNARKNKASLFSRDTEAFRVIDEDYCATLSMSIWKIRPCLTPIRTASGCCRIRLTLLRTNVIYM